jgi:hypothetical protein
MSLSVIAIITPLLWPFSSHEYLRARCVHPYYRQITRMGPRAYGVRGLVTAFINGDLSPLKCVAKESDSFVLIDLLLLPATPVDGDKSPSRKAVTSPRTP